MNIYLHTTKVKSAISKALLALRSIHSRAEIRAGDFGDCPYIANSNSQAARMACSSISCPASNFKQLAQSKQVRAWLWVIHKQQTGQEYLHTSLPWLRGLSHFFAAFFPSQANAATVLPCDSSMVTDAWHMHTGSDLDCGSGTNLYCKDILQNCVTEGKFLPHPSSSSPQLLSCQLLCT